MSLSKHRDSQHSSLGGQGPKSQIFVPFCCEDEFTEYWIVYPLEAGAAIRTSSRNSSAKQSMEMVIADVGAMRFQHNDSTECQLQLLLIPHVILIFRTITNTDSMAYQSFSLSEFEAIGVRKIIPITSLWLPICTNSSVAEERLRKCDTEEISHESSVDMFRPPSHPTLFKSHGLECILV